MLNFIVFSVLVATIRAQDQCMCQCCLGSNCLPSLVGSVPVTNCSLNNCPTQCQCTYAQCYSPPPYGQIFTNCLSTNYPRYQCRCSCCSVAVPGCPLVFVGFASSFTCNPSSCSIECYKKYPGQCTSDQFGQTEGICIGEVTTTTTPTPFITPSPWQGHLCSCSYCPSPTSCFSPSFLGVTSASQCSSGACTEACQARVQTNTCPSTSYLNRVVGSCTSESFGNIKCQCNCCESGTCIDYQVRINGTCSICSNECRKYSPCLGSLASPNIICQPNRASPNQLDYSLKPVLILIFLVLHLRSD